MDWITITLLAAEAAFGLFLLRRSRLLESRRAWIVSILLTALAFALRGLVFDYETLDYQNFLHPWCEFFRTNGGFRALATPVGNYNIPYLYFLALFSYLPIRDLYLIKLLSVFFDVLLAWSCAMLLGRVTGNRARRLACYFTVLLLPTVFLNGAVWGQCDGVYVSLLVLGIYCALADMPVWSMLCLTLSFGFKLQAVFVMPLWAVFWMQGKINWKHLLLFPAAYVLLVLPAVLLGRPFLDTITLYFNQTGSIGSGLNYNSPSIFAVFWQLREPEPASTIGIAAAFIYMVNLLAVAWVNRKQLNDRATIALGLLFAIGIPFLLPHMHDRYFYAADILSVVLAYAIPALWLAAPLTQFASLLGYHAYLKMRYLLPMRYGSAALILSLALALIGLLSSFLQEKKPHRKKL